MVHTFDMLTQPWYKTPAAIIGGIIILAIAGFIAFSYSTKAPPQTDTSHLDAAQVIDLEIQADKEHAQAEATQ